MKKLLLYSIIVVLIFTPLFGALGMRTARADHDYDHTVETATNPPAGNFDSEGNATTGLNPIQSPSSGTNPPANSGGETGEEENPQSIGCISFALPLKITFKPEACFAMMSNIIMRIASMFLVISGTMFDATIRSGVVGMNALMEQVPVVDIGWTIFRDLANISFIFILLWISIGTILGLDSIDTKHVLANVIVIGLLINFSLFVGKAVIDAGNIITIHFYDLITLNGTQGVSAAFMEGLKIQTLYQDPKSGKIRNAAQEASERAEDALTEINHFWNIFLITTFGTVVILVAAFVFFATGLMFLSRFIALSFLLVLSPLAFASYILPNTHHYFEDWWKKLIAQSFFPAIYMILIFVVVKTIQSQAFKNFNQNASFSDLFTTSTPDSMGVLINYVILIGLMATSTVLAASIGGKSAEFGLSMARKARGLVAGSAIMGGGIAFRHAMTSKAFGSVPFLRYDDKEGRTRFNVAFWKKDEWRKKGVMTFRDLDDRFKESRFGNTAFGDFVRQRTTSALMNTKIAGHSAEDSYQHHKELHEATNNIEKRDIVFGKLRESKASVEGIEKEIARQETLIKTYEGKDDPASQELLKNAQEQKKLLQSKKRKATTEVQDALNQLGPEEFAKYMSESDFYNPEIMRHATTAQFAALMKSDRLTLSEKQKATATRFKFVGDAMKRYEEELEAWQNSMKEWEQNLVEWKKTGGDRRTYPKKPVKPSIHQQDVEVYDDIRAFTGDDLQHLTINSDMLKNAYGLKKALLDNEGFVRTLGYGQVQELRKNPNINRERKDRIRAYKDQASQDAIDTGLGISLSLDDTEREMERSKYQKNADGSFRSWEEIVKMLREEGKSEDEILKRTMLHKRANAEAWEALNGKTNTEIAGMRGRFYRNPTMIHHFGRGVLSKLSGEKDREYLKNIADSILGSYHNAVRTGGKMDISDANLDALKWMVSDRRGQEFYVPGDEEVTSYYDAKEGKRVNKLMRELLPSAEELRTFEENRRRRLAAEPRRFVDSMETDLSERVTED